MIQVGLIGYGLAGRHFHAPLIAATEGLRLTAIATSRADQVAAEHPGARACTAAELLDAADIDLVVVATPNDSHVLLGLGALDAGKAVVIDKPMAVSLEEGVRLAERADALGRPLSVFHNRRWDDDFLTLRQVLAEGAIGELVTLESRFDRFRPVVPDRWRDRPGPGAGVWWDLGPHLVDQALQLMGRPDAVTADLAEQRAGATVDDYAHVTLHYGARRAILRAGCLVSSQAPRFAAEGTGGSFTTHGLDPQEALLRGGEQTASPRHGELTIASAAGLERQSRPLISGDYVDYYRAMRDAMSGGPVPVSPADALRVMEILELALASHAAKRTLAVD